MGYDPTGKMKWEMFWDATISIISAISGFAVGDCIMKATGDTTLAVARGTFITGSINNVVNALYYEFSNGESDLTSNSYINDGYITRWERLDYAKQQTEEKHYNLNAWRYNSEYSLHMYGWFASSWAENKNVFFAQQNCR